MAQEFDSYTRELLETICDPQDGSGQPPEEIRAEVDRLAAEAGEKELTGPIVRLFSRLLELKKDQGWGCADLGLSRAELEGLARKHQQIDEHLVSVGARA